MRAQTEAYLTTAMDCVADTAWSCVRCDCWDMACGRGNLNFLKSTVIRGKQHESAVTVLSPRRPISRNPRHKKQRVFA